MTTDHPKPLTHYANDYAWRMSVIRRPGSMEPWECVALRLWTKTAQGVADWCAAGEQDCGRNTPNGRFYAEARRIALTLVTT